MKKLIIAALLAACAGTATAQTHIDPGKIIHLPPRVLDLSPKPFTPLIAGSSSMTSSGSPAPSAPYSDHAILSSFEFGFNNGDHKLRQISVLQKNGALNFVFQDADANDPFQARAEWLVSPSVTPGQIAKVGGGDFDMDIGAGPADSTLVLRGFGFERVPHTDANVRIIGVSLDSANHRIRVALLDDQGPDYTQVATDVATHALFGHVPLGEFFGGGQALVDVNSQLKSNAGGNIRGFRRYAIQVQYAWVPNALIRGSGMVSSANRTIDSGRRPSGKFGLTSFRFAYGNSDHYLLGLGVELANAGPNGYADYRAATGHDIFAPLPRNEVVVFQDSNRDDPISWDAAYVEVK